MQAVENAGADGVTSADSTWEQGIKVVSGRIKVSNAYGSELLPLTLYATAQYYTTAGWTNSTTDSLTDLNVAAGYAVGTGTSATTLTPATGILNNGVLNILMAPPGTPGAATVLPTVVGCALPATCYLPVTQGTATFGVYKGNDRFIYRREN
jgi:MSHA biogenesis protein MshQ